MTRIELIVDHSYAKVVDPSVAELYHVSFANIADLPVQYVDGIAFLKLDVVLKSIAGLTEPVWLFAIVEDLLDRGLVSKECLADAVDVAAKRLSLGETLKLCESSG